MKNVYGYLAIAMVMMGCSTTTQITKFKNSDCSSSTNPEIFLQGEKPAKDYEKIALVTANNKNNGNITEPDMFETMKKEAGSMCADAILVQNIDDTQGFLKQIKTIRAIAVKYKQ